MGTDDGAEIVIRPRESRDLDACVEVARVVHALDGYPRYLPDDDVRRFLVSPDTIDAWVAVERDRVVGHVALHRRSSDAVMDLAASATGSAVDELGVIARLLVSPTARRRGAARRLLDRVTNSARERGLVPILDVVVQHRAAIALYERAGWRRLGAVTFAAPDGTTFDEYVYVAPPAHSPRA